MPAPLDVSSIRNNPRSYTKGMTLEPAARFMLAFLMVDWQIGCVAKETEPLYR
jgi:hypothetical protein